jgi:xanthine/uracil permease
MHEASWVAVVRPFPFGWPHLELVATPANCLVMDVVIVESVGMFLALGTLIGVLPAADQTRREVAGATHDSDA